METKIKIILLLTTAFVGTYASQAAPFDLTIGAGRDPSEIIDHATSGAVSAGSSSYPFSTMISNATDNSKIRKKAIDDQLKGAEDLKKTISDIKNQYHVANPISQPVSNIDNDFRAYVTEIMKFRSRFLMLPGGSKASGYVYYNSSGRKMEDDAKDLQLLAMEWVTRLRKLKEAIDAPSFDHKQVQDEHNRFQMTAATIQTLLLKANHKSMNSFLMQSVSKMQDDIENIKGLVNDIEALQRELAKQQQIANFFGKLISLMPTVEVTATAPELGWTSSMIDDVGNSACTLITGSILEEKARAADQQIKDESDKIGGDYVLSGLSINQLNSLRSYQIYARDLFVSQWIHQWHLMTQRLVFGGINSYCATLKSLVKNILQVQYNPPTAWDNVFKTVYLRVQDLLDQCQIIQKTNIDGKTETTYKFAFQNQDKEQMQMLISAFDTLNKSLTLDDSSLGIENSQLKDWWQQFDPTPSKDDAQKLVSAWNYPLTLTKENAQRLINRWNALSQSSDRKSEMVTYWTSIVSGASVTPDTVQNMINVWNGFQHFSSDSGDATLTDAEELAIRWNKVISTTPTLTMETAQKLITFWNRLQITSSATIQSAAPQLASLWNTIKPLPSSTTTSSTATDYNYTEADATKLLGLWSGSKPAIPTARDIEILQSFWYQIFPAYSNLFQFAYQKVRGQITNVNEAMLIASPLVQANIDTKDFLLISVPLRTIDDDTAAVWGAEMALSSKFGSTSASSLATLVQDAYAIKGSGVTGADPLSERMELALQKYPQYGTLPAPKSSADTDLRVATLSLNLNGFFDLFLSLNAKPVHTAPLPKIEKSGATDGLWMAAGGTLIVPSDADSISNMRQLDPIGQLERDFNLCLDLLRKKVAAHTYGTSGTNIETKPSATPASHAQKQKILSILDGLFKGPDPEQCREELGAQALQSLADIFSMQPQDSRSGAKALVDHLIGDSFK